MGDRQSVAPVDEEKSKGKHNDLERTTIRRAVVLKLWLLGYDAGDIAARILESLDWKDTLRGYEHPTEAIRRDMEAIEIYLKEKHPDASWELIQYMERQREVYRQGMLMAETLGSHQARSHALKVALEASESLARVQNLPVDGIGKVKPKPTKDEESDDDVLPGFAVKRPKGAVVEVGEPVQLSEEAKKRRRRPKPVRGSRM